MAYSGVYVFGDSLVDAGNALKLAEFYGDLTFSDLPDGAPSAERGYFKGRFADGFSAHGVELLHNLRDLGTVAGDQPLEAMESREMLSTARGVQLKAL